MQGEQDEWMRVNEAARLLGVHPSRISRLITRGALETRVVPLDRRATLVNRAQLEDLTRPRPGRRPTPVKPARPGTAA